jgi:anti-anti-sigma factor
VQQNLIVEVRQLDGATVLAPRGELDLASCRQLEEELERVSRSEPPLMILDLREVDFMDSTGLRLVVSADQRARESGRRFGVVNGSKQVRRLLSLTRVEEQLTLVDAPEDLLGNDLLGSA